MRIIEAGTWVLALALFLNGCGQPSNQVHSAAASAGLPRVYTVDSVMLERPAGSPSVIVVKVSGTVRTGGWSGAELQAETTPANSDTIAYEFVATPPPKNAAVTQSLQPVQAELRLANLPARITTLRVDAETNQTSSAIATNQPPATTAAATAPVPAPAQSQPSASPPPQ